ncbi:MAG: ATP-binding protein [Vicinamibacterales bacterium]
MGTRWYRSLYWRIAVGFVLCLATMLVVQALLFVGVVSRSGPTMPGVPPDRFARTVAQELAQEFERDPAADIEAFLREQYGREAHPLYVILADGREFSNGGARLPDGFARGLRERLRTGTFERRRRLMPPGDRDSIPGGRRSPEGEGGGGPFARARRMPGGPGAAGARPAPIVVADRIVGVVIVPPQAPFRFVLGRYLPTLGLVAVGSLLVGTAFTAFLVFGPARRRLRLLEDAARRLGSGDLSARAPAQGGDEVAAVASAFNAMAGDLAARAEALAAADRLRRQLLADVSHELATPVTAMRGYLETLVMPDFPLDEATRARYLAIVTDETTRLERIIGDLLELARLEGGGTAFDVTTVPTAALFERIVARHGRASEAAGIDFRTRIAPGAETVRGDRDRLEQALQNLAANAVRHAPAGSAIDLDARPAAGGGVRLSVTDRGAGIAPEHLPHLFDRFYKADTARVNRSAEGSASHGSGLGLSIVKAIVERHGGRVHVESEPGRTTFAVELPS